MKQMISAQNAFYSHPFRKVIIYMIIHGSHPSNIIGVVNAIRSCEHIAHVHALTI